MLDRIIYLGLRNPKAGEWQAGIYTPAKATWLRLWALRQAETDLLSVDPSGQEAVVSATWVIRYRQDVLDTETVDMTMSVEGRLWRVTHVGLGDTRRRMIEISAIETDDEYHPTVPVVTGLSALEDAIVIPATALEDAIVIPATPLEQPLVTPITPLDPAIVFPATDLEEPLVTPLTPLVDAPVIPATDIEDTATPVPGSGFTLQWGDDTLQWGDDGLEWGTVSS